MAQQKSIEASVTINSALFEKYACWRFNTGKVLPASSNTKISAIYFILHDKYQGINRVTDGIRIR